MLPRPPRRCPPRGGIMHEALRHHRHNWYYCQVHWHGSVLLVPAPRRLGQSAWHGLRRDHGG
eukprot:760752-Hanusia_phi.AAC.1